MNVSGSGNAGRINDEFADLFNVKCVFGSQQMTQRSGDRVLAFFRSQFQDLHVHFVGHLLGMSGSERVPGHAKTAGGKHFFTISIVRKGSRLADQRIDDVSIIDGRQVLADQPRHGLNEVSLMRHYDLFGTDPQVDELADQSAGNRIGIGSHIDRTAARDSHTFDDVVGVEPFVRQPVQMCEILKKRLPPVVIGTPHQVFHEVNVLFTALEVSTATQQERLVNAILEMSIGRFNVAIFVGTASVRAFRCTVVIIHQGRIPLGEFFATGVISHSRRQ